jgi:RNA polymerase sigma factor for flagellar operon FliA
MTPEERQDWENYKRHQNAQAHERLCQRYLQDVKRIVGRMSIYIGDNAIDREDLIHAGVIGLINAIEHFDLEKETGFIEFAFKRIRGAVYDELRNLDGFSSRSRRQQRHLEKVKELLQQNLFRLPSEEETAQAMGISVDKLRALQNNLKNVRTEPLTPEVEDTYYEAAHRPMKNSLPDADGLSALEKYRVVENKIDQLPERTRIIMSLYYAEGLTLKEIAQIMELTESRVCQIHANAIELLHDQLAQINSVFLKR